MKYFFFVLILSLGFHACSYNPFGQRFTAAELKERRPGLYPAEFALQQKKYREALEKIAQEPNNSKHYCALATVYMSEAKVTGEHPYYYPAALSALDAALAKDKNNAEANLLKTSVLLSLHHFAEAKEVAERMVNSSIGASAVYGMLCDANVELGLYEEAVENINNMMQLRPGLDAYARVAYLREIHGDMNGALDAMNMAVQAGLPGSEDAAWTRTTLGTMYYHLGRIQEAEEQYTMARLERNNYPFALAGLAMVRHSEKNYQAARLLLDSAFALMPEVSFVEKRVAIERAANNSNAADSLMTVIESMLDEDEAAGHINHSERALVYCRYNYKAQQALEYARKEIAQRPDNITAQYAMAYSLYRNARYSEAREYMQKALRKNTGDAEMIGCAALIEQAVGNNAEYQVLSQRAVSLNNKIEASQLTAVH